MVFYPFEMVVKKRDNNKLCRAQFRVSASSRSETRQEFRRTWCITESLGDFRYGHFQLAAA